MSSDFEFKVVKVMRNSHRSRQRALRREAKDGWEVVETARGAALSRLDHVTLRRPRTYKAEVKAERRAQRAETVARYEERKAARRKGRRPPAKCGTGADEISTDPTPDALTSENTDASTSSELAKPEHPVFVGRVAGGNGIDLKDLALINLGTGVFYNATRRLATGEHLADVAADLRLTPDQTTYIELITRPTEAAR